MSWSDLPTRIQSIKQPTWFDTLTWTKTSTGSFVTEVDHDWRLWVDPDAGVCIVRNKGAGPGVPGEIYPHLTAGLASLDYRIVDN